MVLLGGSGGTKKRRIETRLTIWWLITLLTANKPHFASRLYYPYTADVKHFLMARYGDLTLRGNTMNKYRLSLDIGTNSIGWCAISLETKERETPVSIIDMGVRVFPDGRNPKDGTSNAVARREARGMRRNRDRFVERRDRLINGLVSFGLLPKDERERRALTALDPYALRFRGLNEKLGIYEFGRAVFHLNQRRGFKSNRKHDAKNKDVGPIKEALRDQRPKMETIAQTFGEYLYRMRQSGESVRARLKTQRFVDDKGKEKKRDYYDFYPGRDLLVEEFDALWEAQAEHHPSVLNKTAYDKIRDIIFYQRPLKPVAVGKCTFERSEDRAPKALPLVQRFRIYQELNHLQVIDSRTLKGRPLRLDERDRILHLFCMPAGKKSGKAEVSFEKIRKTLGLDGTVFSHESEKRPKLEGDTTSALLSHKERFGQRWHQLADAEQEQVVLRLLDEDDEEELIRGLMDGWKLDRKRAEAMACTPLPDTYGRLGMTATRKILEQLTEAVIPYSEAVQKAGYQSHSQFDSGQKRVRLPYYGEVLERHVIPDPEKGGCPEATPEKRFGKVTNPTVHIALNQVRKVVNEVIKLYGAPAEIHVEVLRDLKNSLRQKKEIEAEQAKNQAKNDKYATALREEFHLPVNRENIHRMRLWSETKATERVCPYTGETISLQDLFSEDVEIDHILPRSRTLDDSMANKVLCKRRANREKADQTPFQAWGNTERWQDILDRSSILPKNKRWRFAQDAMEQYLKDRDFIARQLTDSQYIARLAREYLAVLFDSKEEYKVVCLPGRLTGMFRHHLGMGDILDELNPSRNESAANKGEKNRNDHRHHAVDALVIGLMDRAFLQRAASIHARSEQEGVSRFLKDFPEPWPNFRASAREALAKIIVSHKLDHGIQDALHNDTAYGFAKREDQRGNAVHRVSVSDIDMKNMPAIKGKRLRAELVAHLSGLPSKTVFQRLEEIDESSGDLKDLLGAEVGEKEIKARTQAFFESKGIRHVRLIERIALICIRQRGDKNAPPYKGFKPDRNAYLDVFESPTGPQWEGEMVTIFDANAPEDSDQVFGDGTVKKTRRKVIRLFNRDMLEMEHQGKRCLLYIQRMSEKQIALAEHFEANTDSRTRDKSDPFKFIYKGNAEALRKAKVRFLVVTPAGKIRYLSDDPDDSASS